MATKLIPLGARDKLGMVYAKVDADDYKELHRLAWHLTSGGYAQHSERLKREDDFAVVRMTSMHRSILGLASENEVDHINGDRLDNRKANLRVCTRTQNQWNSKGRGGRSGFKGVHWFEPAKCWQVRISANRKRYLIGYFHDSETAAKAYNTAAREYHGEFAYLNDI